MKSGGGAQGHGKGVSLNRRGDGGACPLMTGTLERKARPIVLRSGGGIDAGPGGLDARRVPWPIRGSADKARRAGRRPPPAWAMAGNSVLCGTPPDKGRGIISSKMAKMGLRCGLSCPRLGFVPHQGRVMRRHQSYRTRRASSPEPGGNLVLLRQPRRFGRYVAE